MKRYASILLALALLFLMPLSASADSIYARDITMLSDDYESNGTIKLKVGEKRSLSEDLISYDSEQKTYPVGTRTWTSSKPEVATVSESGVVTAHREGTAKISVVYGDNHARIITSSIRIRVVGDTVATIANATITINEGKEVDLQRLIFPGYTGKNGEAIRWSADKEFTAAVSAKGILEAKRYGTCKVTAVYTGTDGSQLTKTVSVTVVSEYHQTLNKASITLTAGQTIDIIRAIYPEVSDSTYQFFSCRSGDSGIVEVNGNQQITAKKAGRCTITIRDSLIYDEDREIIVHIKVNEKK